MIKRDLWLLMRLHPRIIGMTFVLHCYDKVPKKAVSPTWSLPHPVQFTCSERLPKTFDISLKLFIVDDFAKSTRHPAFGQSFSDRGRRKPVIEQEETIVDILKRQQRERREQLDHALQSGGALDESLHTTSDLLAEGGEVEERVTKFATRVDCVLNTQAQAQSYLASGGQVKGAIEAIKPSLPGLLEQLAIISSVTPSIVCRLQTELEVQDAIATNAQSCLGTLEVVITTLLDSLQAKHRILQPVHKLPNEVLELIFVDMNQRQFPAVRPSSPPIIQSIVASIVLSTVFSASGQSKVRPHLGRGPRSGSQSSGG